MPANKLELMMTVLRQEGPWAVIDRLAFRFFHVHEFPVYRLRLTDGLPEAQIPPDIDVHEATREELEQLRRDRTDLPEYFYRDRNDASVGRCWVGVHEGQLGFIMWISCGERSSDMVEIGKADAELGYIYCMKSLRGRRLTTHAVLLACHKMHAEGLRTVLAVPNARNIPIIKSFLACGFTKVGSIRRYFGLITRPRPPVDYSRAP